MKWARIEILAQNIKLLKFKWKNEVGPDSVDEDSPATVTPNNSDGTEPAFNTTPGKI